MEGGGSEVQPIQKMKMDDSNKEEEESRGESDEEFYEQIEAPKFVDFTLPDSFRPDDRYWFCSRVGCDKKHEEELDPEEISKNFVLRVMAARSPNVKLRRALNGKSSSMNMKCPLSAPAKSTKSRISRLAMISSLSHKLVDQKDQKEKVGLPSKLSSTPVAKSKQVAAKYMTTPRRKKSLPNSNTFRSVQNPKPTTVLVPKNRIVAKALVFHSPKKGISVKSSVELHTPLTKICEGMKRLEITSQKKRVLGYSSKSSKDIRSSSKRPFAKDPSGRRVSFSKGRRVSFLKGKGRSKESLHPQNCKEREATSSRGIKTKGKKIQTGKCNSMAIETAAHDSSDTEIDAKSRDSSIALRINEDNENKDHLPTSETTENFSSAGSNTLEEPASKETSQSLLSDVPRSEMKSSQNSEEKSLEETDLRVQALKGEDNDVKERKEQDRNPQNSSENNGGSPKDHSSGNQPLEDSGHEMGLINSDDKENTLTSDINRDDNCNNHQSSKKILGSQETLKNKKAARIVDKNLKDGLVPASTVMKYKKPKLTNPKPFRLRTDERGILKEANLDRKVHFPAPQNEVAKDSGFSGVNPMGAHGNSLHVSFHIYSESSNDILEVGGKRIKGKDEVVSRATPREPKSISSPLGNVTRTRLPYLKQQLVRPQGVASPKKAITSSMRPGRQLSVITETSKLIKPVKAGNVDGTMAATNTASASRSTSRGKRPVTIPKEPKFHSSHVPKSCTRNVA